MSGSFKRYEFSVVESAAMLASSVVGSLEGVGSDELARRAEWLHWRSTDGWTPFAIPQSEMYDHAVRCMAWEALRMYQDKFGPVP